MRADYERNWQVRRKPPAWERHSPLDLSASLSSSLRRTVSSNGALLLHDQPLHASSFTSLPTTTSFPKPVNSSSTRLVVGPDGSVLHELTDAHQELAQYSLADSQRRLIGLPSGNVARTKLAVRRAVGARVADAVKQQALQQQQLQRRQLQLAAAAAAAAAAAVTPAAALAVASLAVCRASLSPSACCQRGLRALHVLTELVLQLQAPSCVRVCRKLRSRRCGKYLRERCHHRLRAETWARSLSRHGRQRGQLPASVHTRHPPRRFVARECK